LSEADEDDEEDKPLAARMGLNSTANRPEKTSRKVPAHRSGKKTSSMKSKDQTGQVSTPTSQGQAETNVKINGANGHKENVKVEDKMDESQLTRLATGVTVDAGGPTSPAV